MTNETKKLNRFVTSGFDITLALLVVMLCLFGVIMIYSTSSYNAERYYSDSTLYLYKQLKYAGLGTVLMIGISFVDYRLYFHKFCGWFVPVWALYFLCLGLQIFVLIYGYAAGGSSRWIEVPVIGRFQPSELTKICVVLFTAYLVQRISFRLSYFTGFIAVLCYIAPLIILVAVENLSTAIVIAGIFCSICFVVSRRKGYYVLVALLGVAFVVVFIYNSGYRGSRIETWLNPDSLESGSQILQGLYAIASGGFLGKGLGESIQKLGNIPEVHTDMVFTVICEELGIVGALMVIGVYLVILWRLFSIAYNAPDMCGSLITTGVFTHIALQMLINIAVVTNSIPATGMPLPFVSYGGTNLLVLMCETGLALSVSRRINADYGS